MKSILTIQSLEELLNDEMKIIIDLDISLGNLKRLTENRYEYEEDIKREAFFVYHWNQLWFLIVVQLAKLYGPVETHHRSFNKLCKMLRNYQYSKEVHQKLKLHSDNLISAKNVHTDTPVVSDQDDFGYAFATWIQNKKQVDFWDSKFKSKDEVLTAVDIVENKLVGSAFSGVVNKVLDWRNQIYAHRDTTPVVGELNLGEIELLISEAGNIFSSIYDKFFEVPVLLAVGNGREIDYVLHRLSLLRQRIAKDCDDRRNK